MRFDRKLIGALLLGMLALASSAYGISISVSSNAGGFTENINAGDGDSVFGSTIIGSDRLSNSIEGSGSLKESHSVSYRAGANAGVGVDIRNAEKYSYDYYLSPDKSSKSAPVMAGEELDVLNAEYIEANAQAFNAKGYTAEVSTVIHDPGNQASLIGYRNIAMASKDEAMASQTAESAFAPNGSIQADSGADFMQLKSHPLRFRWDTADASIRVDSGSLEGYSDLASASAQGIWATQQMDAATGERIRTKSESASWRASLFQGLKGANAMVTTTAEGNISGYNASARSSEGYAEADQAGHIVGTFTSTALGGKASKTRTSNYGTEYDFDMQARKDAAGSYAAGTLGYYVDNASPVANRIQGAVDASESGDAVNIAPGTYFENVQIDKSLTVKGAGAGDTIVDGQQSGSVFTIGKNNPKADVTLSGMAIQGGTGTPVEISPYYTRLYGGGVLNFGTMKLNDSTISGNIANDGGGIYNAGTVVVSDTVISENNANDGGFGGGIYNDGKATIVSSTISENVASGDGYGGGIYNGNTATLSIDGSIISGNDAIYGYDGYGGGIYNEGLATITRSIVSGNWAYTNGGGICNNGTATLNVYLSTISENHAHSYGNGGGIYNEGNATVNSSEIFGNTAFLGGGIYSGGSITIANNNISENSAAAGGGIRNSGMATVIDSHISENTVNVLGGGIYNSGTVIVSGDIISENTAYSDGGGIYSDGTIIVEGSTISKNAVHSSGGGIYSSGMALVTGSNISENVAKDGYGGGIYSYGYGSTFIIADCNVTRNSAYYVGGGIYSNYGEVTIKDSNILENEAVFAGGIYNGDLATLNIDGSLISENTALSHGGGILNRGLATIAGSTISKNTAGYIGDIYSNGGGIYNAGTLKVADSNITENSAYYRGGGIYRGFRKTYLIVMYIYY